MPSNSTAQRFTDFVENLFTVTLTWLHLKLTLQVRAFCEPSGPPAPPPPHPPRPQNPTPPTPPPRRAAPPEDFAIWPEVFHDKVYNLMSDLVDVGDCAMLLRDE